MRGDFRDCYDAVTDQEREHKLLFENTMDLLVGARIHKVKFKSGIGLESLKILEKITKDSKSVLSLRFIC